MKPDRRSPGAHESSAQIDVHGARNAHLQDLERSGIGHPAPADDLRRLAELGLQFGDLRPASVHDDDGVPRAPQLDDVLRQRLQFGRARDLAADLHDQARV